ncbi:hypothetical protein [Methylocaldum marinum]|uniref:hypothetical protein n=1 Tax=Methylocaldum marinum TaxID=1432792 RepID=UPI0011AE7F0C|nr:hypothetical protein [Methylocaldum marinum]
MNHLYDEDGVKIVMSSVQLAAVLSHDTIPEPATFSNRLWGGIRTVAGVLELVGAGALCLAQNHVLRVTSSFFNPKAAERAISEGYITTCLIIF